MKEPPRLTAEAPEDVWPVLLAPKLARDPDAAKAEGESDEGLEVLEVEDEDELDVLEEEGSSELDAEKLPLVVDEFEALMLWYEPVWSVYV